MSFDQGPYVNKDAGTFTGTFTGTGIANGVAWSKGVDVFISGSFIGTVLVQCQAQSGVWMTAGSITSAGFSSYESKAMRCWRLKCFAFTSGEITYCMEAAD